MPRRRRRRTRRPRRDVAESNDLRFARQPRLVPAPKASDGGVGDDLGRGRATEVDAARALRGERGAGQRRARSRRAGSRSVGGAEAGPRLGEQGRAPAATAAAALVPFTVAKRGARRLRRPGLGGRERRRRARVRSGLTRPPKARPREENGATRSRRGSRSAARRARPRRRSPSAPAGGARGAARRARRRPECRSPRRGRCRPRQRPAVQRTAAAPRRAPPGGTAAAGSRPAGDEGRTAGDEAEPADRRSPRAAALARGGGDGESASVRAGADRAGQRHAPVEEHVSPRRTTTWTVAASRRRASAAPTVSARRRAAGPRDASRSAARPAPSFPAGATTSVSSASAPATACDSGLSAKEANGSASADERDPRRVVGVAVAVRVDGPVEPGDQLVGARVDGAAAVGVRLPAGNADRQHGRRRARRRASPPGPPAPTSRPAISVPCRSTWAGRSGSPAPRRRRCRRRGRTPAQTRPWRYGLRRSTPVSRSAIVTPRPSSPASRTSGRCPAGGARASATAASRRPPGTRPAPGRRPSTSGDRSSSATARGSRTAEKPFEDPREAELRPDAEPAPREGSDNCCWAARPAPSSGARRRRSPGRLPRDPLGERRRPSTTITRWPIATGGRATADEAAPGRRPRPRRRRRLRRTAAARGDGCDAAATTAGEDGASAQDAAANASSASGSGGHGSA